MEKKGMGMMKIIVLFFSIILIFGIFGNLAVKNSYLSEDYGGADLIDVLTGFASMGGDVVSSESKSSEKKASKDKKSKKDKSKDSKKSKKDKKNDKKTESDSSESKITGKAIDDSVDSSASESKDKEIEVSVETNESNSTGSSSNETNSSIENSQDSNEEVVVDDKKDSDNGEDSEKKDSSDKGDSDEKDSDKLRFVDETGEEKKVSNVEINVVRDKRGKISSSSLDVDGVVAESTVELKRVVSKDKKVEIKAISVNGEERDVKVVPEKAIEIAAYNQKAEKENVKKVLLREAKARKEGDPLVVYVVEVDNEKSFFGGILKINFPSVVEVSAKSGKVWKSYKKLPRFFKFKK